MGRLPAVLRRTRCSNIVDRRYGARLGSRKGLLSRENLTVTFTFLYVFPKNLSVNTLRRRKVLLLEERLTVTF